MGQGFIVEGYDKEEIKEGLIDDREVLDSFYTHIT